MQLQEWENYLSSFISQIELLGEIPLLQEDLTDLEKQLASFVHKYGLTKATRYLESKYPITFVTYLAFKAALNDERGFWDQVAIVMGENAPGAFFQGSHHWGKTFQEIIKRYPNLRYFEGISGPIYVTPIRLHGGIPAYSLPDYFKYILLPSVQKSPYRDQEDTQALSDLLSHYTAELFVDDVVRHFFQHGGEAAQRFFSKCRKMARLAADGQPIPPAEKLGLRPYVVQLFENYWQNPPEPALRRRLPRLYFEPYTPALSIRLPAQPIAPEEQASYHRFYWGIRLMVDEQVVKEEIFQRVRVQRSGHQIQTEETFYQPQNPATHAEIRLIGQDEEGKQTNLLKRSIRLLPPGEIPIQAFRYNDNSLCSLSPVVPARELWLFYPADCQLSFSGTTRLIEELHPFPPPWNGWQAHLWDLREVTLIHLQRGGVDVCPPLPVRWVQEPQLSGTLLPQSLPVEEKHVYVGVPSLELPIQDINQIEKELERWNIEIESRFAASPHGLWQESAAHLPKEVMPEKNTVRLSSEKILGTSACGTYHLTLRQGNKAQLELPFRVLPPTVRVIGLQPYYLPESRGAKPVQFSLFLPEGFSLKLHEDSNVQIDRQDTLWQVTVPEMDEKVALQVEQIIEKDIVRVPFKIEIPRLKWAVRLSTGDVLQWQSISSSLPLAKLLQSAEPRLYMKIPAAMNCRLVELQLVENGEKEALQVQSISQIHQRDICFDLHAFHDTLRNYPRIGVFDFNLSVWFEKGQETFTVLRCRRDLDIRECHIEVLSNGRWRLHWFEPHPLRQRYVRIWCLWQPWADPLQIPIPDENIPSEKVHQADWWQTDLPEDYALPPSRYRIQFVAMGKYDLEPPPPNPPPEAILVEMVSPSKRLKEIDEKIETQPMRAFILHLEKACIYEDQKDIERRDQEIQWLNSKWNTASLRHLYFLQDWLKDKDTHHQRAISLRMFNPATLQKLQQDSNHEFVQRYLNLVPELRALNPESAFLVISMAKDPLVIRKALTVLIQGSDQRGLEILQSYLNQGKISEEEAAQILLVNPDFALPFVEKMEDTPVRSRLLGYLTEKTPNPDLVIRKGYWVLCEAGWGKITAISNANSTEYFLLDQEKPILQVSLRDGIPQSDVIFPERAQVDLTTNEIKLIGRKAGYICQTCNRFITSAGKATWDKHSLATQHEGNFFPIRFPYLMKGAPRYFIDPPKEVFSDK